VARIISDKRPEAFILENVKNLKSHDRGRTFRVILQTLEKELGYSVDYRVFDTRAFVPQHRERIFIVGFRRSRRFSWPVLPAGETKMADILDPAPDRKYTLSNHLWSYLKQYAEKHRAAGNGFGFGLVNPSGIARSGALDV
jgi:DNA (cytosine-5)-methyltransferase 1